MYLRDTNVWLELLLAMGELDSRQGKTFSSKKEFLDDLERL